MKKYFLLFIFLISLYQSIVFAADEETCEVYNQQGVLFCTKSDGKTYFKNGPVPENPEKSITTSLEDKCSGNAFGAKICINSEGKQYVAEPAGYYDLYNNTTNNKQAEAVSRGDGVLRYEMVSYSGNKPGAADTPFFNIGIFNSPTFTIDYKSFSKGFQDIFDFIIGISIAIAVVVFMIAAFQRIIDKKDVAGVKAGDEGMWNAIVGLMIILSTWLIINTINPDLLRLSMFQDLDKLKPANSGTGSGNGNVEIGPIGGKI